MAKNNSINATETAFVIEGLRKLALQYDTKTKYALQDEDEEQVEQYQQDIADIRTLLKKLGDTKPLVLKSERKSKPKAKKAGVVIVKQSAPKASTKRTKVTA